MNNNSTSMCTQPWQFDSTRSVGQYTNEKSSGDLIRHVLLVYCLVWMNAGWELLLRTIEIAQITITLSQDHMLSKY